MTNLDRYLDPPDIPHSDICDECHDSFDADDLREAEHDLWLCPACFDKYIAKAARE